MFFIPFCCFVYLQSLPRYLPKSIFIYLYCLFAKNADLSAEIKRIACLIIRFSSSTSEEYPALGCFFLLCLRLRLLLHLLLRFLFNFLVCLASHDATATATAEAAAAAAGNAQRRQQSVGEGQLERGGESVREREGEEGKGTASKGRISSAVVASRFSGIIIIISLFFLFFLYFILSSLMASFFRVLPTPRRLRTIPRIYCFSEIPHTYKGRGRGRERRERGEGDRSNAAPNAVACVFSIKRDIRLINLFGSRITQLDRQTGGLRDRRTGEGGGTEGLTEAALRSVGQSDFH